MSDNYLQNTILSIESELSSPRASAGKLNIILHTIRIQEKVQERIVARNYKCCGRSHSSITPKPAGKLNTGMASTGKSPSYNVLELLDLERRLWLLVPVRHSVRSESSDVEEV